MAAPAPANSPAAEPPVAVRTFASGGLEGTSPEIEGLLAEAPRWPVQWGALIVLGVIGFGFAMALTIRFPDVVTAPLVLTTTLAPVTLRAASGGRLDTILVGDKESVRAGQPLAIVETDARHSDIEALRRWLAETSLDGERTRWRHAILVPPSGLRVGPAADAYVRLAASVRDFNNAMVNSVTDERLHVLAQQRDDEEGAQAVLSRQHQLADSQATLSAVSVERVRALRARGFATDAAVDAARADYLQRQSSVADAEANERSAAARAADIQATELSLIEQRDQLLSARIAALRTAIDDVRHELSVWDDQSVVRAPFAGRIGFLSFLHPHDVVQAGQELFAAVPDSGALRAEALLSVSGSGNVRAGQAARLSFAEYSPAEVGYVDAVVSDISLVPRDTVLLLHISLPHGLITTYGVRLPFRQRTTGIAEIVTGRTTIIGKLSSRARVMKSRIQE